MTRFGPGLWRRPGDPGEAAAEAQSWACFGLLGPRRRWDSCVRSGPLPEAIPLPWCCLLGHPSLWNPTLRPERGNLRRAGSRGAPGWGRACLTTRCLNREGRRQREVVSEKDLPPATPNFCKILFPPRLLLQTTRLNFATDFTPPPPLAYACGFFSSRTVLSSAWTRGPRHLCQLVFAVFLTPRGSQLWAAFAYPKKVSSAEFSL